MNVKMAKLKPIRLFNMKFNMKILNITISILFFLIILTTFAQAIETCNVYDPVKDIVSVKCSINFIQLANEINDPSKIANLGNGEWLLNTNISTVGYTTFSISSKDGNISWLKIANGHGIVIGGRGEIDGVKITSWDTINNTIITEDKKKSIPRGYIYFKNSNGGFINNSDIGYLGYKKLDIKGIAGVSFYDSHDVILYNNKFHDIYFAFYSSESHNITIDNNEYYHNLLYAIDPHTDSDNFTIKNNHVHNNYKFGIIFSLRCTNFLVENNTIHDNNEGKTISYGIFFSRMSDNNTARNNIIYNESIGIDLSQSSNNEVYNNKISNTIRGIYIRSGEESIAANNYIHDNEISKTKINMDIIDSRGNAIVNNSNTVYGSIITELDNELTFSPYYIYDKLKSFLSSIFGLNNNTNYVNNSSNNSKDNISISNNSVESEPIKNSTVIISFDDGSRSVYDNAFPIMKANNQKGVVYIVTSRPDKNSRGYMNWSVLREMYNAGWDVSSHTVNHVNLKDVDDIRLNYELNTSRETLISQGFEKSARFIAYPYGGYDDNVVNATKANGYATGRTTMKKNPSGEVNLLKNEKALYTLSPLELHNFTTIQEVENAINKTINNKTNLILVYHIIKPDDNTTLDTYTALTNFKIISDYIASRKDDISVITMSEYYDSLVAKSQNISK